MILAILITIFTILLTPTPAPTAPVAKPVAIAPVAVVEQPTSALDAINAYRATKSLAPVSLDAQLTQSAEAKASDMVNRNYWSHITPDGQEPWGEFIRAGYQYSAAGENLAKCFKTDQELVTAWIASPTHEAVMSGDYRDVGLGEEFNTKDNCEYVVAHFGVRQ